MDHRAHAGDTAQHRHAIADADDLADEVFLKSASFITPPRLFHRAAGAPLEQIKSAPAFFDADGIDVSQHFATSDDGTSIPYFLVAHQDSSEPRPTLLYGYGSYGSSQTPGYSGSLGRLWLAHGCNYVVANIRGGGEYGPPWHMQAVRTAKHKSYEDFACIARDPRIAASRPPASSAPWAAAPAVCSSASC